MYMKTRNISIHKLKRQPRQGWTFNLPSPYLLDSWFGAVSAKIENFDIIANAKKNSIEKYFNSVIGAQSNALDLSITTTKEYQDNFRTAAATMDDHNKLLGTSANAITQLNKSYMDSRAMTLYEHNQSDLNTNMLNSIKNNTFLEQRNASLNKSFGVTSRGAAGLAEKFLDYAQAINGVTNTTAEVKNISTNLMEQKEVVTGLGNQYAISSLQIGKYAASLQTLIPLLDQTKTDKGSKTSAYIDELYKGQMILETSLGLSQEHALAFQEQATFSDKSALTQLAAFDAYAKGIDPNGTAGVYKGVIQEIAALTSDISIHYAKQPLQLAKSVMKMKQLGLTMNDLYTTGEKLLDIESSIENELSYQLITGNQLIGNDQASVELKGQSLTNAFREAHLSGKSEDAAEAMNQILAQESDTLKDNLFARKEMAKLLGITEQQLASSLAKKEILDVAAAKGLTIDLNGTKESLAAAQDLLEKGAINAKQFEALIDSQDQRTTEDIAKSSLTALQELVLLNSGKLDGQVGAVNAARGGSLDSATDIQKLLAPRFLQYMEEMNDTYGQKQALDKANKVIDETTGTLLGLANKVTPEIKDVANDAIIPPGNGSRILSFPEDKLQPSIAFNDQDTITASTQAPTYASTMPPTPESDTSNPMLLIADVLNKLLSKSPTTTTTAATADSGQHIMQVGKMIVAALQNQTGQLKPKPIDNTYGAGLNKPHFSGKI